MAPYFLINCYCLMLIQLFLDRSYFILFMCSNQFVYILSLLNHPACFMLLRIRSNFSSVIFSHVESGVVSWGSCFLSSFLCGMIVAVYISLLFSEIRAISSSVLMFSFLIFLLYYIILLPLGICFANS